MALPTMEWTPDEQGRTIWFQFNLSYANVEQLIQFIQLIMAKFGGKEWKSETGRFWRETGKEWGAVRLKFSSREPYDGAVDHCRGKLTKTGKVRTEYVGALGSFRSSSPALLEKIRTARRSN